MTSSRRSTPRVLLFAFRLPMNPSRYRVSVWRRLRRAGAESVARAFFRLPDTPLNRLRTTDLVHDIENWGGAAWCYVGETVRVSGETPGSRRTRQRGNGRVSA